MSTWLLAFCAMEILVLQTNPAAILPARLRCEFAANLLGIDTPQPRLSWILESEQRGQRQTAYQILAASNLELLNAERGDLWDSGKVESSESIQIVYAGKPLDSGQRVYWKVRVWDRNGNVSAYSAPAWWEMALLKPADWQGKWIRQDKPEPSKPEEFYAERPAPLLRKTFQIEAGKKIKRARAYVSGLGYSELHINGRRVGDQQLDPGWTAYAQRVLYSTYDVTEFLKDGENAVGAMLGNGWYNPLPLWGWGSENRNLRKYLTVGPPRFILQLNIEYEDDARASVVTDESWKAADGPIVRNDVYLGEQYDARLEQPGWDAPRFDDSAWKPAILAGEPLGPLQAQTAPPIRITRRIKPVAVTQSKPGVFIFDFGQNFAGWMQLRVRGERGTRVTLRSGEILFPDGTLNAKTSAAMQIKPGGARGGPGAPADGYQTDVYILKGGDAGDEIFTPRFTFHGFRYVEVTGFPGAPALNALEGLRLNSDVTPVGSFACSNELFNRIHEITQWTLLSNLFGVQSDCPHREKFGYGGDAVASSEMAMFNYDMAAFYAKMVRDYADAARPNGGFTETAPFVGIADESLGEGSGPVEWGTAHPLLCWQLYQYYGDRRMLAEQYPAVQRWLQLLEAKATDFLLVNGIGDHESLVPKSIGVTGTAFYFWNAELAAKIAGILGKTEDARRYAALAEKIRAAFNQKFLDPATGRYDGGTQCNQATALWLNLAPPEKRTMVFDALVKDILETHKGHLTTGIFGTKFMPLVLSDAGRADVAYTVVNQKGFPGWGHMLAGGATTLWETWAFSDNTYSHNHPMFGSVDEWFYKGLAGIRPADDAVGFDKIIIRPQPAGDLTWVKASYDSMRGKIASEWKIEGAAFRLDIVIPCGATAIVYIPAASADGADKITEGGKPARAAEGVKFLRIEDGAAVFVVEAGRYQFTSVR